MKICTHLNCGHPVFSKGLCRYHSQRFNERNKIHYVNTAKISLLSKKRVVQQKSYTRVKKEVETELQETGRMFCFLSGEVLGFSYHFHHLNGRIGSINGVPLLIYKPFIIICKPEYHTQIHSLPISKLETLHWWSNFMLNLEKYAPELYQKYLIKSKIKQ